MRSYEAQVDLRRRNLLELSAFATLAGCARVTAANVSSPPGDRKTDMQTRPLMTLRLRTAPTQDTGTGPHGTGVTFPISGGSFEGDRLRGNVLPGGDDWTTKR